MSLVRSIVEVGRRSVQSFFEHRMAIYAEQLSYRGIFGFFPFIILVFALLAVLRVDVVFDRLIEAAVGVSPQQIPEPLEPVAEEGRAQAEFLRPLIEQAREQAGGGLLSFGIVISLWSVAAVTFTLTEALNVACGVEETRSRRKRFAFALVFGPLLALAFIVASGLMLIGPRVAGWLVGLAGLDETWVALWGWLRFPVALFLLAAVLSVVYRFVPDADRSFWSVDARRSLRRDRMADRFAGVLVLPVQLRGSRPDLRQPRDGRGPARLPLHFGVDRAAGSRDQRGRLPHPPKADPTALEALRGQEKPGLFGYAQLGQDPPHPGGLWSLHCPDLFIASPVFAWHERIRILRSRCRRSPGHARGLRKTRRHARPSTGAP